MSDLAGSLWLEAHRLEGENAPGWVVMSPDGESHGPIAGPVRFVPHEIGADYLLGVWRDEFDVEYVRRYELAR